MIRMMVCMQEDTPAMEIYLPQSIVFGKKPLAQALAQPVIGYYALDLTGANKGKPLEPVKVSMTTDGKTVIVDQYTRGLPPTRIRSAAALSISTNVSLPMRNAGHSRRRTPTTGGDGRTAAWLCDPKPLALACKLSGGAFDLTIGDFAPTAPIGWRIEAAIDESATESAQLMARA
jgi:hypothetical protein